MMNVVPRDQTTHRVGNDVDVPRISILLGITDVFPELLGVLKYRICRLGGEKGTTCIHNPLLRFFTDWIGFPIVAVRGGQYVLPRFPRTPIAPKPVNENSRFRCDLKIFDQLVYFLSVLFKLGLNSLKQPGASVIEPRVTR